MTAHPDFILRSFIVTVKGFFPETFLTTTRGQALAAAWKSGPFASLSYGEFLKIARCQLHPYQPEPVEITVEGKPALSLGYNGQYVQFVWPGGKDVLNAHPLDVLPESRRPRAYRSRAA